MRVYSLQVAWWETFGDKGRFSLGLAALWLVLTTSLLWWLPPSGHDAFDHAVRAVEVLKGWRCADFWPRFQPDWNAGTGSFAQGLYPPLTPWLDAALLMVVGEARRAVGLSLVLAVAAGAAVLSLFPKRGFGAWGLLWIVTPFAVANMATRATVTGEWSLVAVAGVLFLALPWGEELSTKEGCWLAMTVAVLVATRASVVPLLAVILGVTWFVMPGRAQIQRRLGEVTFWSLLGVLFSAPVWMPGVFRMGALEEGLLVVGEFDWRANFMFLPNARVDLNAALHAVTVIVFSLGLAGILYGRRADRAAYVWGVAGVVSVFFATPLSWPVWATGVLAKSPFPWHALGFASICGLGVLSRLRRPVLGVLFVAPVCLVPWHLAATGFPLHSELTGAELAQTVAAYRGGMPLLPAPPGYWAPGYEPFRSTLVVMNQPARLQLSEAGTRRRRWQVLTREEGEVVLPVQWWPEWTATVEGRRVPFRNRVGLVAVSVQPGVHDVQVELEPSWPRRLGGAISFSALVVVLGVVWLKRQSGLAVNSLDPGVRQSGGEGFRGPPDDGLGWLPQQLEGARLVDQVSPVRT